MKHYENEPKDFEKKLEEYGIKEEQIFEDDDGLYFWQEAEIMDEGENESYKPRKIYIK